MAKVSSRNIRANADNIVPAAREMGIPIKTALDVFYGEPVKLLLGMHQRVIELREEERDVSDQAGESTDFDPVVYVVNAARNRGWGVYRDPDVTPAEVDAAVPDEVARIDLSGIEDDEMYERVATLMEDHTEWLLNFLRLCIEGDDGLRADIDRIRAAREKEAG